MLTYCNIDIWNLKNGRIIISNTALMEGMVIYDPALFLCQTSIPRKRSPPSRCMAIGLPWYKLQVLGVFLAHQIERSWSLAGLPYYNLYVTMKELKLVEAMVI